MLAEKIAGAEEYLAHFQTELEKQGVLRFFPKINAFYHRLAKEFLTIFHSKEENLFVQWGHLLAIDAQLQILMEISNNRKEGLLDDLGISEEEVIEMIENDHKYFYREITGAKLTQKPKMGLIYLSEHLAES